jgi:RHS repeat-associated protein
VLRYHDLTAGLAVGLLKHQYGSLLAGVSAQPAVSVASAGRLIRYEGAYRAVVQGAHGLMLETSSVPLRARDRHGAERPVSLALQTTQHGFAPANPLTALSIARASAGGVTVGTSGLQIAPEGRTVTGAIASREAVFYGDVRLDEDAVVTPTVGGTELFAVLRSRLSPQVVRYRVTLPAGAKLSADTGGAVVTRDGNLIASVPAPVTRDAQGTEVPTTMTVSGDQLVVSVPHRTMSVDYPLLVDPTVDVAPSLLGWGEVEYYGTGNSWFAAGPADLMAIAGEYPDYASIYDYWVNGGSGSSEQLTRIEFDGTSWTPAPYGAWGNFFFGGVENGVDGGTVWSGGGEDTAPSEIVEDPAPAGLTSVGIYIWNQYTGNYTGPTVQLSVGAVLLTAAIIDPGPPLSDRYGNYNPAETYPSDPACGHPVDCATGNQYESQTDFHIPGTGLGLDLTRTYNSQAAAAATSAGQFGYGWSSSYSDHLVINTTAGTATVTQANGSTVPFTISGSSYVALPWVKATLVASGSNYIYTLPNQTSMLFSSAGVLVSESDRYGDTTSLTYNGSGELTTITDPSGRSITLAYNSNGTVSTATDPMGNTVTYGYTSGNLTSVTNQLAQTWTFGYDTSHELTSETDPRGELVTTSYDASHRVVSQTDALSRTTTWNWNTPDKTVITDPNGNVITDLFDSSLRLISSTDASGTSIAATTSYTYDANGNLLSVTDPDGHETTYVYNSTDDRTSATNVTLSRTTAWTYNTTHDVTSMTMPGGEVTTNTYTGGKLTQVSRPIGSSSQQTSYAYTNSSDPGAVTSVTNPDGYTTTYTYDAHGNLVSVTDADVNETTYTYDADGRRLSSTTASGNASGANVADHTTNNVYDALGELTKVTGTPSALDSVWPGHELGAFSIPTGTAQPADIVSGPGGNLWFTESAAGKIAKITPAGVVTEYAIGVSGASPQGLAVGADGNVWFADKGADAIGKVTPSGTVTEYAITADSGASPMSIAQGPSGTMRFTASGSGKIGSINTTTDAITETSLPSGDSQPESIVSAGGGVDYFADYNSSASLLNVASISSSGTVTDHAMRAWSWTGAYPDTLGLGLNATGQSVVYVIDEGNDSIDSYNVATGATASFAFATGATYAEGLTVASDGSVWYTTTGAVGAAHLDPVSGATVLYTTSPAATAPYGITQGPDGQIWFADWGTNDIYRMESGTVSTAAISIPTASAGPTDIVPGPGGDLWFTESSAGKIGKVAPSGAITEYSIGVSGASPQGLAMGGDGNIWFADKGTDSIGKVTPSGTITEYAITADAGAAPTGIAAGPSGTMRFTATGSNKIGSINTSTHAITETSVTAGYGSVENIVSAGNGVDYFDDYNNSTYVLDVAQINAAGTITQHALESGSYTTTYPGTIALGTNSAGQTVVFTIDNGNTAVAEYNTSTGTNSYFHYPSGATNGTGLTVAHDGAVWYSTPGDGAINYLDPTTGATVKYATDPATTDPDGITQGPDGEIWVLDWGTDDIYRVSLGQTSSAAYPITTAYAGPTNIITGPDGNMWFSESNVGKIAKITPTGAVTEYAITGSGASPQGLAVGGDGNIWFADKGTDAIGMITTAGVVTEYPITGDSGASPTSIAQGPSGTMRFTATGSKKIGSINTSTHAITETTLPSSATSPQSIASAGAGVDYFDDTSSTGAFQLAQINSSGTITYISMPSGSYTSTYPGSLAIGQNASSQTIVYVIDDGNKQIDAYNTATTTTSHDAFPSGSTAGQGLTVAADGTVWYTTDGSGTVTQLNPATAATIQYPTSPATVHADGIVQGPDGNIWALDWGTDTVYHVGIQPLVTEASYTYDADGNQLSATNADGQTASYAYDADNEPTSTTLPDGTTTSTGYDADGNVTSQTDGRGKTTTYTYNALDQRITAEDPDSRTTTYGYDGVGNLTSLTDPAGRTTTNTYDAANELTAVSYSDGVTPNATYTYTSDGLPHTMVDGTGTTTYTYDALDRLTQVEDGNSDTIGYGYDLANNQTTISYPGSSHTVTRTFDHAGNLASVEDWLSNTTTFAYDADNNLATTTFPGAVGQQDTYAYDNTDQPAANATVTTAATLASVNYTYDPAGNLAQQTTVNPSIDAESYTYSPAGRLIANGSNAYNYDNTGNATLLPGSSTALAYDNADQLTSGPAGSYTYNSLGQRTELTAGSVNTNYAWNQADELTANTGGSPSINLSYGYDGNALLQKATTSGTTKELTWDATTTVPVLVKDGTTNIIYGPDQLPIEQIGSSGTPIYYHHDQLGSTILLTNASGTSVETIKYSPYGTPTITSGTATTDLLYASQYTDPTSGLIYMQARWYDPATAQFLSADPLEAVTGAPYNYAGDDPTDQTDPTGLGFWSTVDSIGNGVSNFAAGTLNGLTGGLSTQLAADIFGFNASCANFGTAGEIGSLAGFGGALFFGEGEAELATEDAADESGEIVYRVHGGGSDAMGRSWTPTDPTTLDNPRDALGLPDENSGEYLSTARVKDWTGAFGQRATAIPEAGTAGGAPEYVFPNPEQQLEPIGTQPLNPPF